MPEEQTIVVSGSNRDFTLERCRVSVMPFITRHVTWRALAAGDIRSKYRRTFLGPWWITATNAVTALIMGLVAGRFLGADMKTYLPHFMVSMTIWNFINSSLAEACFTMINAGGMIKAVDMPILIHVMRMVQRNFIIFLHNAAIIPIIWLFYRWDIHPGMLLAIPGIAIVYVFVVSASMIISMICVRYRDVPPIMTSLLQVLFFISPIIWIPTQIRGGELIILFNPIAYLLSVTRGPIMAVSPGLTIWLGAIGIVAALTAAMAYIYTRYRSRVVYWA